MTKTDRTGDKLTDRYTETQSQRDRKHNRNLPTVLGSRENVCCIEINRMKPGQWKAMHRCRTRVGD